MKIRLTESEFHSLVENCVKNVLNEMSPALLSQEQVIQQFIDVHGEGRYDYSRVQYANGTTRVIIGCNKHWELLNDTYWFKQTPKAHKEGKGCPKCRESHMEKQSELLLHRRGIIGVNTQYPIPQGQTLDFYIEQTNEKGEDVKLAIECQGEFHDKAVEAYGGMAKLQHQKDLDKQKADYCRTQNIPLEEIWYYEDLESKWNEIINKYHLISQSLQQEDLSQKPIL